MELRHLRYFVAVAEEENITRAAARLHVSQPPLTRQIRDLEEELGFELLSRSGKTVRLTEAGRTFAVEARAVLSRVEEAIAKGRAVATGTAGELNLGYAPSPTIRLLPAALSQFQRQHPEVRVTLHDHSTPEMLAGLRDRRLHLALMMEPPKPALVGIAFERLHPFPIMLAVSPTHPFARRRSVSIAEAVGEPTIVLSRREFPDYHALLARVLGDEVERLHLVEECDGGMSLIAAIEAGRGCAVIISALADNAGRRVRMVPLRPAPAPAWLGVAHLSDAITPVAEKFAIEVRKVAKRKASTSAASPLRNSRAPG
jgi:DNA-binding transcriptional LysR family regulator